MIAEIAFVFGYFILPWTLMYFLLKWLLKRLSVRHGVEAMKWENSKKHVPKWMYVMVVIAPWLIIVGACATIQNDFYEEKERIRKGHNAANKQDFIKRAMYFGRKMPEDEFDVNEPPKRSKNDLSVSIDSENEKDNNNVSIEDEGIDKYDKYKEIMEQKGIEKPKHVDKNMLKKNGCAHDEDPEDPENPHSDESIHSHKQDFGHQHEHDQTNHEDKHGHEHGKKNLVKIDYKKSKPETKSMQNVPEPVKSHNNQPNKTHQNLPDNNKIIEENSEPSINDSRISQVGLKEIPINAAPVPLDKRRRRGGIIGLQKGIKVDVLKEKVYKVDNVKAWIKFEYEDKFRKFFNQKSADQIEEEKRLNKRKKEEKTSLVPESKLAVVRNLFNFNVDKKAAPMNGFLES